VQFAIEPVEIELSSDAFQRVAFSVDHALKEYRRFDLNASDSSDDELPAKRFDLNDSDPSDDESPDIGRLSMLQGGPYSQDTGQATVTDEDNEEIAAVKAAKARRRHGAIVWRDIVTGVLRRDGPGSNEQAVRDTFEEFVGQTSTSPFLFVSGCGR